MLKMDVRCCQSSPRRSPNRRQRSPSRWNIGANLIWFVPLAGLVLICRAEFAWRPERQRQAIASPGPDTLMFFFDRPALQVRHRRSCTTHRRFGDHIRKPALPTPACGVACLIASVGCVRAGSCTPRAHPLRTSLRRMQMCGHHSRTIAAASDWRRRTCRCWMRLAQRSRSSVICEARGSGRRRQARRCCSESAGREVLRASRCGATRGFARSTRPRLSRANSA
jgi:hypothetical protein